MNKVLVDTQGIVQNRVEMPDGVDEWQGFQVVTLDPNQSIDLGQTYPDDVILSEEDDIEGEPVPGEHLDPQIGAPDA